MTLICRSRFSSHGLALLCTHIISDVGNHWKGTDWYINKVLLDIFLSWGLNTKQILGRREAPALWGYGVTGREKRKQLS